MPMIELEDKNEEDIVHNNQGRRKSVNLQSAQIEDSHYAKKIKARSRAIQRRISTRREKHST